MTEATLEQPILVTGAAGFIGFHVAQRLLGSGRRVVGFDNVNDYYDPALKRARLAELGRHPGFTFVEASLHDPRRRRRDLHRARLSPCREPRRAGWRALFGSQPLRLRGGEPHRVPQHPRGLSSQRRRAPPLRLLVLRLRRQHVDAVLGPPERRPPAVALRRDQEGERADGARLRQHLRACLHGPALLHGVRALGPARHGDVDLRQGDPGRRADHALQSRRHAP